MSRYGPSFSQGHYTRPNYLADALKDISGTALQVMGEARADSRLIREREAKQAFEQQQRDLDQANLLRGESYRAGRDAVGDARYIDELGYNRGRDVVSDRFRTADADWNHGGGINFQRNLDRGDVNTFAQSLAGIADPNLVSAIGGMPSMQYAAPLGNSVLNQQYVKPKEDASDLANFIARLKAEKTINPPAPRGPEAPIMYEGAPYSRGPNNTLIPYTLPGGAPLPGKVGGGKLTATEEKASAFYTMASDAVSKLDQIKGTPTGWDVGAKVVGKLSGDLGNALTSGTGQLRTQASKQLADAWLRFTSGAAVPPHEIANFSATFTPSFGDSKELQEVKRSARQLILKALEQAAGNNITAGSPEAKAMRSLVPGTPAFDSPTGGNNAGLVDSVLGGRGGG